METKYTTIGTSDTTMRDVDPIRAKYIKLKKEYRLLQNSCNIFKLVTTILAVVVILGAFAIGMLFSKYTNLRTEYEKLQATAAQQDTIHATNTSVELASVPVTTVTETPEETAEVIEGVVVETPTPTITPAAFEAIPLDANLITEVVNTADEIGIDPAILMGLIRQESNFQQDAISSDGHDYGLCQIRDSNFKWIRENLGSDWNPLNGHDAIHGAAFIIKSYMTTCDSYHDLLMNYNLGPGGANKLNNKGYYSTQYSRNVISYAIEYGYDNTPLNVG